MRRGFLVAWIAGSLAIGGWAWMYLFAPGSVPEGQPPLGDAASLRRDFAAASGKNRIVAVLSPTTPADLVTAQRLQGLLMEYENEPLNAFIAWTPKTGGDWAPTSDAMARVWDPRVRQYWDKKGSLSLDVGGGRVLVYARGAGLTEPALRVEDWEKQVTELRAFLATPKRQP